MLVTPWGTPTLGTTALENQFQLVIHMIFILGPAISLLQIQETGNSFTDFEYCKIPQPHVF